MAINRTRAKLIHECLFYALWGTAVAFVLSFAADVPSVLRAALVLTSVALFLLWLLLPPVPVAQARKRQPAKRKSPGRGKSRRRKKGWHF